MNRYALISRKFSPVERHLPAENAPQALEKAQVIAGKWLVLNLDDGTFSYYTVKRPPGFLIEETYAI